MNMTGPSIPETPSPETPSSGTPSAGSPRPAAASQETAGPETASAAAAVGSGRGGVTLRADRVFTGEGLLAPGHVTIDGERIVAVGAEPPAGARVVDLGGHDLLPGLVDLHSDCWHHRARPRPSTHFALDETLVMLDTEVVSWGITTHYVCVALQEDASKSRTPAQAAESVAVVEKVRGQLRADHRIHLRVEATSERLDLAADLAASPAVSLLSYMDHTPGQGQYKREQEWRTYLARIGETDLDGMLARRLARQPHTDATRAELARLARRHQIALASHDDDTAARVEQAEGLGATISEFPVSAGAAAAATERGLLTVMGAPNALRGTSHLAGNLSAREALATGHLGALASDYHPPCLLGAIYALPAAGLCDLPTAVALATSNPARAVGLADRGRLAPGARADLVAVAHRAGRPVVAQTWIAGTPVFGPWSQS
ncbi:alpha-D-ribose 1-methylphosphonate 5-triphosphate diphosphatase [Frankia sp. CNm7]|uniref:Alpha-D-ribose 1-methylphosphonate 5-triphosphate diphosphatase n=1 Tax=Frankia nepalensis TaxID=1836974 RepID=A0A937RS26_9ACTN|nr:alpha-D-ribose 1-methylphosphonate 5-triphosphate diphosphatase [Frankia nepalensis]MBL7497802.1 alpha-D-ribose 1-methylphosphonate 5-triphosphate diphosphatase [Frankia nepalensis]MBL7512668.1 alpha-D-ribose 1-methylphosphonate 5-triphosphate diphosphatase [Frankia nepalensis]MBL7523193.1 alpha-D-ribose 1-methylphosphonate 5-triphosphate diphosphatase [Frankia nepalensis]MBL7631703.1 alpha-D-ribose 1-methylphosphonate 5-triphosphate diphosphatase [Frankia nepalensis]